MISDTLISPRADHDIRKRSANYKRRTDVPNFRDILRQRCRERVKARRGALFDNLRSLNSEENIRSALSQFIENDLKELQYACSLEEKLRNNGECMDVTEEEPLSQLALSEREKWILTEYDKLIENIDAQVELASMVVCPMCSRGVLNQFSEWARCSLCSLALPLKVPLAELERMIIQAVDTHNESCNEHPQFTLCPDDVAPSLLILCTVCALFQQIV